MNDEYWRHGTSTLVTERDVFATAVEFAADTFTVHLVDGRAITIPLAWYPRLFHADALERANYQLIGAGEGLHWPSLDEDISVESLVAGRPSAENNASLRRWLQERHTETV